MTPDPWIEDLRHQLATRKMSAAKLAKLSGISPKTISKWLLYESRPYRELQLKVEAVLELPAPEIRVEDKRLKEAIFAHPDLGEDGAERVWQYAEHVIEGERKKGSS